MYSIGVLDFVFDEHRQEDAIIHTAKLKDQNCQVFYDKLTFIYIELPKFEKPLEELTSQQDKWLYLFRHLPDLEDQPRPFQDPVFLQIFEIAEIANFSRKEQASYQSSLKYYRDMNNVIDTSREEGEAKGRAEGLKEGAQKERLLNLNRQKLLIGRLLDRTVGRRPSDIQAKVENLSLEQLNQLAEALLLFDSIDDLARWLKAQD